MVVDIREDGKGGIKIPGLTETPVSNLQDTMKLLEVKICILIQMKYCCTCWSDWR